MTIDDVGNAAAFLLSDLAAGISAEITYVDGGFSQVMGGPELSSWAASASATSMPSTAGRHDAAGVAGALAGRVQALDVQALKILAAGDAQRRRGARLDAGQAPRRPWRSP